MGSSAVRHFLSTRSRNIRTKTNLSEHEKSDFALIKIEFDNNFFKIIDILVFRNFF